MLRLVVAFVGLALSCSPLAAQTWVQTSTNQAPIAQGALEGFDYRMGTLDSVTLLIEDTENRAATGHVGLWPEGAPSSVDVNWTIDGNANFFLFITGQPLTTFSVPIFGTGAEPVTVEDRFIAMMATGSASFDVDPALIPQWTGSGYDFRIGYGGPGFYDGSDVQFVSSYPLNSQAQEFYCEYGGGEEACNFLRYTLTYNYTLFPDAIPEPSTWAMMLIGFASIGFSIRYRKRGQVMSATA